MVKILVPRCKKLFIGNCKKLLDVYNMGMGKFKLIMMGGFNEIFYW